MLRPLALIIALLVGCTSKTTPDDDTHTDDPTDEVPDDTGSDDEPIVAGTETVSASWDVDMFSLYESPTLPRFDTLGGRRQLDGMIIAVDHSAVVTINLENGGPVELSAEDYEFQFYFNTIMQLGTVDEDEPEGDEGPPFFGPGSFQVFTSADLPVGDDDPETEDYVYEETFTRDVEFEAHYDPIETPTYLEAMIGEEPITVVVGGFSEYWADWVETHGDEAYLLGGASALQYAGTLTVTYEYSPTGD